MVRISAGALCIIILHNLHLSNYSCASVTSVAFHGGSVFMHMCTGASFHSAQTGNTKFHSNLSVCVCLCATQIQNQQQKSCVLSKTNLFIE